MRRSTSNTHAQTIGQVSMVSDRVWFIYLLSMGFMGAIAKNTYKRPKNEDSLKKNIQVLLNY